MAPQSAAQSLQGHRPRPSTSKPIVPAIPLPYMQKRRSTAAVPKKTEEAKQTASVFATPVAVTSASVTPVPSSPTAAESSPNTASDSPKGTNATEEEAVTTPATSATPVTVESPSIATGKAQSVVESAEIKEEVQQSPPLVTSEFVPTESRSSYNMPPPFVPANGYPAAEPNLTRQTHFSGPPPMHFSNPANVPLVFGASAESNNTSPVPPGSGGGLQFLQQEGGRVQPPPYSNGHMHNHSNGFSPMAPPQGQFSRQEPYMNYNGPDNFVRRQMTSFGPSESYSPSGPLNGMDGQRHTHFDATTPHSFQGSQSSLPNDQDQNGHQFYNSHVNNGSISNAPNGHGEDIRLYQPARPKQRTGSQGIQGHHHQPSFAQPNFFPDRDDLDGLIGYLQAQFGNPTFADYTLELRYSDDRATPVRLPGHNLLFARSSTLKSLMTAQVQEPGNDALSLRTLFIETDDRFLRSDAFQMAVQRLYGAPLLHPGVPAGIQAPSMTSNYVPGTPTERFDLALGYAAAGHLLRMPPVVHRGIDVAGSLLTWQTVERAFDFSLDGGLDPQWLTEHSQSTSRPTYGPHTQILLMSALNFVITSFPPNFELNTEVPAPPTNARLPSIPEPLPPQKSRFSRLQFGDHTDDNSVAHAPALNQNPTVTILSKLLINMPYPLLKYVLESSRLGNVSGWATASLRMKVMHAVIEEREKRRVKVYESKAVSDVERQTKDKEWEVVGWKENIVNTSAQNGETSVLSREWVGFESS